MQTFKFKWFYTVFYQSINLFQDDSVQVLVAQVFLIKNAQTVTNQRSQCKPKLHIFPLSQPFGA